MKKVLYSVYDVKSEFYGSPVLFHNDEDARRGIASVFSNPGSMMATYPEDYRLFRLGNFNDNSGSIEHCAVPEFVCELSSLNPHPHTLLRKGDVGYEDQIDTLKGSKACPERR